MESTAEKQMVFSKSYGMNAYEIFTWQLHVRGIEYREIETPVSIIVCYKEEA